MTDPRHEVSPRSRGEGCGEAFNRIELAGSRRDATRGARATHAASRQLRRRLRETRAHVVVAVAVTVVVVDVPSTRAALRRRDARTRPVSVYRKHTPAIVCFR